MQLIKDFLVLKMDKILRVLNDSRKVAKFQQLCGLEVLPDDTSEDNSEDSFENDGHYDKYVRHRQSQKYVLKDKYMHNNNIKENNLQKEVVPPFASDDSDSDNSQTRNQHRFRLTPHRINNKFLYYAFRFASFAGDEAFYLTFLPFFTWNIDSFVGRRAIYVWCVGMYWGQVLKDIFQWRRPSCPPVVRLDRDFAQEFSMPSTHAVAASSIPFMMAYGISFRYQIPSSLVWIIAIVWCLMTCGSRLYLGVHSLLDVVAGCLISFVAAAVIVPFIDEVDWFVQTNPAAPVLLFIQCVAFSTVLYPAPEIGNNTKCDCIKIIAIVTGYLIGTWCNYFNGLSQAVPLEELYEITTPSLKLFACAILRFIFGVIIVLLIKIIVQTVSLKTLLYIFGLTKADKQHPKVQVAYRFITYMTLGVVIVFTVPIILTKFGLGRPGYYLEVL